MFQSQLNYKKIYILLVRTSDILYLMSFSIVIKKLFFKLNVEIIDLILKPISDKINLIIVLKTVVNKLIVFSISHYSMSLFTSLEYLKAYFNDLNPKT